VPAQEVSIADDSAIMISSYGQEILSLDGKTMVWWRLGRQEYAGGKDFKTFVAWGEPPHGPGIGRVSLLDGEGKMCGLGSLPILALFRRGRSHHPSDQ
jgi:hypothetical protein